MLIKLWLCLTTYVYKLYKFKLSVNIFIALESNYLNCLTYLNFKVFSATFLMSGPNFSIVSEFLA